MGGGGWKRIHKVTLHTRRIQNTETCVHKITNLPVFYMALGLKGAQA